MKYFFTILSLLALISCTNNIWLHEEAYGKKMINRCMTKIQSIDNDYNLSNISHVYVYIEDQGSWINFAHGSVGTFGKRSHDYKLIFSCAIVNGSPEDIVYLGSPFKKLLIDKPSSKYFSTPEGSIEILFNKKNNEFKYCCSQIFQEENIKKHNPDFPWKINPIS